MCCVVVSTPTIYPHLLPPLWVQLSRSAWPVPYGFSFGPPRIVPSPQQITDQNFSRRYETADTWLARAIIPHLLHVCYPWVSFRVRPLLRTRSHCKSPPPQSCSDVRDSSPLWVLLSSSPKTLISPCFFPFRTELSKKTHDLESMTHLMEGCPVFFPFSPYLLYKSCSKVFSAFECISGRPMIPKFGTDDSHRASSRPLKFVMNKSFFCIILSFRVWPSKFLGIVLDMGLMSSLPFPLPRPIEPSAFSSFLV